MNRNGFLYGRPSEKPPNLRRLACGALLLLLGSAAPQVYATQQVLAFDDFLHYQGTGLSPVPTTALDSDNWRVAGLSEGDTAFGSSVLGGDFGRGVSLGGVTSGGVYAFDINGDIALGVQATGTDFTPGGLTRRVINDGLESLTGFQLDYEINVRNDGDRSMRWQVDWSVNGGSNWQPLEASTFDTPQTRTAAPDWQPTQFMLAGDLAAAGQTWLPGSDLLLRWSADDLAGTGGRDEVALDDIRVMTLSSTSSVPLPPAVFLMLCALGSVLCRHRASTDLQAAGRD